MGIVAQGQRVALREFRENDMGAIEAWYGEAARAAYDALSLAERWLRAGEANDGLLAVLRHEESEPIGLLECRLREPEDGWLTVGFVALAKAYRGWGYGSEAVRLLEEWAMWNEVAGRFRADVDARNGLGLYFWLRLGYRPARRQAFGWPPDERRDMMPMIRTAH